MRRRALRWAVRVAAAVTVLAVVVTTPFVVAWARADIDATGADVRRRPLHVPPLAPSTVDADGTRVVRLTPQEGSTQFVPGVDAPTWGYDGDLLGPTLRLRRGERVRVDVTNRLPEPTTVHWHGMHLPAAADGGPHQPIAPGATRSPSWTVDQPAATLWYHPHLHGRTAAQTARGLAGVVLVDDDEADALDLPDDYGVDDLPLVVQDRTFDDGRLVEPAGSGFTAPSGPRGDQLLVNGTLHPYHEVTTERVRLRLVNGSAARSYAFGFPDGRELVQVGSDGGLLAAPHRTDRVQLSPGERAEVVVTLTPGETAMLRSFPQDLGTDPLNQRYSGGDDTFDVVELRAAPDLAPSPPVPQRLADVERLDPAAADRTRTFALGGREVNGQTLDMGRIDATVDAGATEVWEVTGAAVPHNFHVHGVSFQVAAVDGAPPPPDVAGWKDTVYLRPEVTYRLVARFEVPPDPGGPFMLHCHLLAHEDEGMAGQFVVAEPGSDVSTVPPPHAQGGP